MVSASHFSTMLQEETTTITGLCDKWENVLNDSDRVSVIPDEVCGKIQIAVGQAKLLMRKKFEQFRKLLAANETGASEKQVTVEDLQGFWELMQIQVSDIYDKFQEVEKLQNNKWEPLPMQESHRQPLGNLNKSTTNSTLHRKSLVVQKDFTAQAKERLAQAKAMARKRLMEEQCCQ